MSAILAALINGGIAGAAVTLAVWLVMSIAPRRVLNAATRYAVWWTTLLLVVYPAAFLFTHAARNPSRRRGSFAPAESHTIVTTEIAEAPAGFRLLGYPSEEPPRWPQFPLELSLGAWPIRIFTLWGIAAVFMLLRLSASYVVLERRKRRAHAVEKLAGWPVRALVSPDIASPMAAGLFRPGDPAPRTPARGTGRRRARTDPHA